jgi:hypothetical protein
MLPGMAWSEDTSALFRDFGVTVTHGARTARAILDQPTTAMLDGGLAITDYQITLAADELATLGTGDTVSIGGAAYTVREVYLLDDGAMKRAVLTPS